MCFPCSETSEENFRQNISCRSLRMPLSERSEFFFPSWRRKSEIRQVFWKTLAEIEEVILSGMDWDGGDDGAAAHAFAAAGVGAGSPELLRRRSQHCCARGGSSAGPGHGGGRGSVLAQTGFCQLRHFSEVFGRVATPLVAEQLGRPNPSPAAARGCAAAASSPPSTQELSTVSQTPSHSCSE
eukprot:COSAG02_NODE_156_length_33065_cov_17.208336_5_plen_183_part_00